MILERVCQHCDSELAEGTNGCRRCGAPAGAAIYRSPHLPAGFQLYQNAWKGFATCFPKGWMAETLDVAGVAFHAPDGQAHLELGLLPAGPMLSAGEQARLLMQRFPGHRMDLVEDGGELARGALSGPTWQGLVSVHLTPRGGTLGLAYARPGSEGGLEQAFAHMLGSLSPIAALPRERWSEPQEGAFTLDCPVGWQRQAQLVPPPTPTGARQPTFRLGPDPSGQIILVAEPEFRTFLNRELPAPAPEGEGFFQKLGRFARQMDQSMAGAMGEVVCPFRGLRPAFEVFFWPHWQRALGCQLLSFEDRGKPDTAEVRLLLPGDIIQVFGLRGMMIPGMGSHWLGGHTHLYRAPAALMPKFEPIFAGIVHSVLQNQQWQGRERQRAQQLFAQSSAQQFQMDQQWLNQMTANHNQRMADISMQGQAATQAHYNNMQMHDMQMQSWQNQQASSDRMHHQNINQIREHDDFVNPHTGAVHNLSQHVKNYWDTGQDLVVGSDLELQVPPTWTPLKRL